jgi:putative ABC transport system permease protein
LLARPLSKLLSDNLGVIFLKVPLTYSFPISGVLIWLMIMIILSAFASFLPARRASQVSVNQALTYE